MCVCVCVCVCVCFITPSPSVNPPLPHPQKGNPAAEPLAMFPLGDPIIADVGTGKFRISSSHPLLHDTIKRLVV